MKKMAYVEEQKKNADGSVTGAEGWAYPPKKGEPVEIHKSKLRWWRSKEVVEGKVADELGTV